MRTIDEKAIKHGISLTHLIIVIKDKKFFLRLENKRLVVLYDLSISKIMKNLRQNFIDSFPCVCNIVFNTQLATIIGLLTCPIDSTLLLTRFDLKSKK